MTRRRAVVVVAAAVKTKMKLSVRANRSFGCAGAAECRFCRYAIKIETGDSKEKKIRGFKVKLWKKSVNHLLASVRDGPRMVVRRAGDVDVDGRPARPIFNIILRVRRTLTTHHVGQTKLVLEEMKCLRRTGSLYPPMLACLSISPPFKTSRYMFLR